MISYAYNLSHSYLLFYRKGNHDVEDIPAHEFQHWNPALVDDRPHQESILQDHPSQLTWSFVDDLSYVLEWPQQYQALISRLPLAPEIEHDIPIIVGSSSRDTNSTFPRKDQERAKHTLVDRPPTTRQHLISGINWASLPIILWTLDSTIKTYPSQSLLGFEKNQTTYNTKKKKIVACI